MPSTEVEIHIHPRIRLNPKEGVYACQVPKGAWHTVEVYEPSVIIEAKNGAYGEDGSEMLRTTYFLLPRRIPHLSPSLSLARRERM